MTLPADYHLHTPLCRHATGEPHEYASRALEVGLTEIGFSDHSPMRRDDFDAWRMRFAQLDEYVEAVRKVQRDCPRLAVKLALEVDYLPGQEDWIQELAARHPWDYLIGSVHYVSDAWAIDDPSRISEWRHREPDDVWAAYFERLTMAVETKLFDVIGHADLPKKFGFHPRGDCQPMFERFLKAAKSRGVAIELNTAGLRKECHEIYPSLRFVQLMFRDGIPITFGSDAHATAEVGAGLPEAVRLARAAGYVTWCRLARGHRESVPL